MNDAVCPGGKRGVDGSGEGRGLLSGASLVTDRALARGGEAGRPDNQGCARGLNALASSENDHVMKGRHEVRCMRILGALTPFAELAKLVSERVRRAWGRRSGE